MQLAVPQNLRYLNPFNYQGLFTLGNDEHYDWEGVEISTEDNLMYLVLFKEFHKDNIEEWEIEG
jgi:hypothetical protein